MEVKRNVGYCGDGEEEKSSGMGWDGRLLSDGHYGRCQDTVHNLQR